MAKKIIAVVVIIGALVLLYTRMSKLRTPEPPPGMPNTPFIPGAPPPGAPMVPGGMPGAPPASPAPAK